MRQRGREGKTARRAVERGERGCCSDRDTERQKGRDEGYVEEEDREGKGGEGR